MEYKESLEKIRLSSEKKFDILVTIIGILLVLTKNDIIGYPLLTMLLASHYTSAKAMVYGIWEHSKESEFFDKITKILNLAMLVTIAIYSIVIVVIYLAGID